MDSASKAKAPRRVIPSAHRKPPSPFSFRQRSSMSRHLWRRSPPRAAGRCLSIRLAIRRACTLPAVASRHQQPARVQVRLLHWDRYQTPNLERTGRPRTEMRQGTRNAGSGNRPSQVGMGGTRKSSLSRIKSSSNWLTTACGDSCDGSCGGSYGGSCGVLVVILGVVRNLRFFGWWFGERMVWR